MYLNLPQIQDVCVIVRSVGEKTESKCLKILEGVFPEDNIFLVKNVAPFSKAVATTFEIGIEHNKRWTLAVDADVLFFENRLREFVNLADACLRDDGTLYCVLGLLFDKFSGRAREVGFHLYNTALLKEALRFVNEGENHLRPETYVKYKMEKSKHNMLIASMRVGIHDFFQYKKSIVKKALLLVRKNSPLVVSSMIALWKEQEKNDIDFHYALLGAALSEEFQNISVKVDSRFMEDLLQRSRMRENIEEAAFIDDAVLKSTLECYDDGSPERVAVRATYPLPQSSRLLKYLLRIARKFLHIKRFPAVYRKVSENRFERTETD